MKKLEARARPPCDSCWPNCLAPASFPPLPTQPPGARSPRRPSSSPAKRSATSSSAAPSSTSAASRRRRVTLQPPARRLHKPSCSLPSPVRRPQELSNTVKSLRMELELLRSQDEVQRKIFERYKCVCLVFWFLSSAARHRGWLAPLAAGRSHRRGHACVLT